MRRSETPSAANDTSGLKRDSGPEDVEVAFNSRPGRVGPLDVAVELGDRLSQDVNYIDEAPEERPRGAMSRTTGYPHAASLDSLGALLVEPS